MCPSGRARQEKEAFRCRWSNRATPDELPSFTIFHREPA
ncbi:MAG: hypothetical protein AVDCRST_MAG08-2310 [uncultured Acetobacteraceae bacterium]|uniref:Uncharacterized protein n=1 Tax=uncultured Acetobacteraceae bacterium TaxID=169975 RepID=A0A6J4INL7_9PROT|nr:MAG: hypothetical protein AVDCRST_MAG08-2310 [uncultured Acetobacteraceae bacterium]